MPSAPLNVVISYSPIDREHFTKIANFLQPHVNRGSFFVWHKGSIAPGQNTDQATANALQTAHAVILLLSIDYLTGEWQTIEPLLKHLPQNSIIPVLVRPCCWDFEPVLQHLSILPDKDTPPVADLTETQLYQTVVLKLIATLNQLGNTNALPLPPTLPSTPPTTGNAQLMHLKYTCNRTVQKGEFLKSTLLNRQQKILYFYIRGLANQSTDGLSKRFYHREIPGNPVFGGKNISPQFVFVPLLPDDDPEVFKLNFIDDLAQQLKCTNQDIYLNANIEQLLSAVCVRPYDIVCIGLKLKSEKWSAAVPPFLEWLLTQFCQCNQTNMPVFLFFLLIDYASQTQQQQIETELKQLKARFETQDIKANLLSPLDKVPKIDIEIWLEANLRRLDDADRTALLQQYFANQTEFDMREVEQTLETILEQYNAQFNP